MKQKSSGKQKTQRQVADIIRAAGGYLEGSAKHIARMMISPAVDPISAAITGIDVAPKTAPYRRQHILMPFACMTAKEVYASALTLAIAEQFPGNDEAVMRVPEHDTGLTACFQVRRDCYAKLDIAKAQRRWPEVAANWSANVPYVSP